MFNKLPTSPIVPSPYFLDSKSVSPSDSHEAISRSRSLCSRMLKVGEQLPHRFLEREYCLWSFPNLLPWELPSMSMSMRYNKHWQYLLSCPNIFQNKSIVIRIVAMSCWHRVYSKRYRCANFMKKYFHVESSVWRNWGNSVKTLLANGNLSNTSVPVTKWRVP